MENDGERVGRIDARDGGVIDLARRDDTWRRVRDALVARLDVARRQSRAVVKQDIGPKFEAIGEPIGRNAPRLRQVADDPRIISGIEFEQGRVMRRDGVQESKGYVAVTIVIAGLDGDRELERSAVFGAGV